MVLVGWWVSGRVQLRRRLLPILRLGFLQHQLLAEFVLRRIRQLFLVALVVLLGRKLLLWQLVLWRRLRILLWVVLRRFFGMLRWWRLWAVGLRNVWLRRTVRFGLRTRLWPELWLHWRLRLVCRRLGRLRRDDESASWSEAAADAGGRIHAPNV